MKNNKTKWGIVVTQDFEVQIHGVTCKDFVTPTNRTNAGGDYAVMELLVLNFNPRNIEELKEVLATIMDCVLNSTYIKTVSTMGCTDIVGKKTQVQVFEKGTDDKDIYAHVNQEYLDGGYFKKEYIKNRPVDTRR